MINKDYNLKKKSWYGTLKGFIIVPATVLIVLDGHGGWEVI